MGQFRALSEKNWILWKRGYCGNIIEVIIPIIFIAFIAAIRKLVKVEAFPEQSFLINPTYTAAIYGQQSTATAAGGSMFLKTCPAGTVVGLAPSGNAFVSTLNSKLAALGYTVEQFASDADITSRVRSFDYGVATGKFCFAVTVSEATLGGSYKYKLHFNESAMGNTEGPASTLKLMIDNALDVDLLKKTKASGMMGTTTFINNLILQQETGSTNNVFKNV